MQLECIINGNIYPISQGATISEEHNETLDSGSILVAQVPRININKNDIVYIYEKREKTPDNYVSNDIITISKGLYTQAGTQSQVPYLYILNGRYLKRNILEKLSIYSWRFSITVVENNSDTSYTYSLDKEQLVNTNVLVFRCATNSETASSTLPPTLTFAYSLKNDIYTTDTDTLFASFPETIKSLLYYLEPRLEKYFVVNSFQETLLNKKSNTLSTNSDNVFSYQITLKSETSLLEGIDCPNLTITQKVNPITHKFDTTQRTVADYIELYLNLYGPKIKVIDNDPTLPINEKHWKTVPKYVIDKTNLVWQERLTQKVCPEKSYNNQSLREVLQDLAYVCDSIIYVEKNTIKFKEMTEPTALFEIDNSFNMVQRAQTGSDYMDGARVSFQDAINNSQLTYHTKNVGFRDLNSGTITSTGNLKIEFQGHKIYKIEKFIVKYLKDIAFYNVVTQETRIQTILIEQDISKLLVHNSIRNLLDPDYQLLDTTYGNPTKKILNIEDMARYKYLTLGYDIGGSEISGFSNVYDKPYDQWLKGDENAQFTTIETILNYMDYYFPTGINNISQYLKEHEQLVTVQPNSYTLKAQGGQIKTFGEDYFKGLFFEISYYSMSNFDMHFYKEDSSKNNFIKYDNQSSSLAIIDNYASNEQSKLNRMGNPEWDFNSKVTKFSDIYPLGAIYDNGDTPSDNSDNEIIIYHREIGIHNNFIVVNYKGIRKYLLKDYYTSVSARHRVYSVASYQESTTRNEIRDFFIELNTTYEYQSIDFKAVNDNDNFYYFLTAVEPHDLESIVQYNYIIIYKDIFEMLNTIDLFYINATWKAGTEYDMPFSDTPNAFGLEQNTIGAGNALIFNFNIPDNYSLGNFVIDPKTNLGQVWGYVFNIIGSAVTATLLNNYNYKNQSLIKGSLQSYYQYADQYGEYGVPSSRNESVSIFMGKYNEPSADTLNNESNYLGYIYFKPLIIDSEITDTNGNSTALFTYQDNLILKDNKEKLNYSLEFSYYSTNQDIIIGDYFSKLNNLINKDILLIKNNSGTYKVQRDVMWYDGIEGVRFIGAPSYGFYDNSVIGRNLQLRNIMPTLEISNLLVQKLKTTPDTIVYLNNPIIIQTVQYLQTINIYSPINPIGWGSAQENSEYKYRINQMNLTGIRYNSANQTYTFFFGPEPNINDLKYEIVKRECSYWNKFSGTQLDIDTMTESEIDQRFNNTVTGAYIDNSFCNREIDTNVLGSQNYSPIQLLSENDKYSSFSIQNLNNVYPIIYAYNYQQNSQINNILIVQEYLMGDKEIVSILNEIDIERYLFISKNMFFVFSNNNVTKYQARNLTGTYFTLPTADFTMSDMCEIEPNGINPYMLFHIANIKRLANTQGISENELGYFGIYYEKNGEYNLIIGYNINENMPLDTNGDLKIFATFKDSKDNLVYESQENPNIRGKVATYSDIVDSNENPLNLYQEYVDYLIGADMYYSYNDTVTWIMPKAVSDNNKVYSQDNVGVKIKNINFVSNDIQVTNNIAFSKIKFIL